MPDRCCKIGNVHDNLIFANILKFIALIANSKFLSIKSYLKLCTLHEFKKSLTIQKEKYHEIKVTQKISELTVFIFSIALYSHDGCSQSCWLSLDNRCTCKAQINLL